MAEQHVPAVDSYPFVAFLMGSALMANVITSVVAPLEFHISIIVNFMVSLAHSSEQWNFCNMETMTVINPLPALRGLQTIMVLVTPTPLPLADLPKHNLCFLLYATVEVCGLCFCWWAMQWAEVSSRIQFLRHSLLDRSQRNRFSRKVELLRMSLHDPLISAVRTLSCSLCLVATVWAVVITASLNFS